MVTSDRRVIGILDAPTNLGLRPPRPGAVPRTWRAPAALRAAGLHQRLTSRGAVEMGSVAPAGYRDDVQAGSGRLRNQDSILDHSTRLADKLGEMLDSGHAPLVLGGDCSLLVGAALALARRGRYGLVHVDGHTDFRHPGNSDACASLAGEDLAAAVGTDDLNWPGSRPSERSSRNCRRQGGSVRPAIARGWGPEPGVLQGHAGLRASIAGPARRCGHLVRPGQGAGDPMRVVLEWVSAGPNECSAAHRLLEFGHPLLLRAIGLEVDLAAGTIRLEAAGGDLRPQLRPGTADAGHRTDIRRGHGPLDRGKPPGGFTRDGSGEPGAEGELVAPRLVPGIAGVGWLLAGAELGGDELLEHRTDHRADLGGVRHHGRPLAELQRGEWFVDEFHGTASFHQPETPLDLAEAMGVGGDLFAEALTPFVEQFAHRPRVDLAGQHRPNLLEREAEVFQADQGVHVSQLPGLVVAIARVLVHLCGVHQSELVVVTQHPNGHPGEAGEVSDTQHGNAHDTA